jgi:hypothetical protein
MVLLANLGSRAWHFLGWYPQRYNGMSASIVAYMAAVATGIFIPYMGHRDIEVGGKAAMEYVIKTALLVAVVFVISDLDEVQKFIIVGSEVRDMRDDDRSRALEYVESFRFVSTHSARNSSTGL